MEGERQEQRGHASLKVDRVDAGFNNCKGYNQQQKASGSHDDLIGSGNLLMERIGVLQEQWTSVIFEKKTDTYTLG